jgi:hypothetical protein
MDKDISDCSRCGCRISVPFDDIVHDTFICRPCYKIRENEQDYKDKIEELWNEE